jgi:hypothetical protein
MPAKRVRPPPNHSTQRCFMDNAYLSMKMERGLPSSWGVRKALLDPLFGRLLEVEDEAQGGIKSSQLLERQMARAFT